MKHKIVPFLLTPTIIQVNSSSLSESNATQRKNAVYKGPPLDHPKKTNRYLLQSKNNGNKGCSIQKNSITNIFQ
ncbi:hypothetical protein [Spartinivicinus ruber]|uniref:hypothetical protein n=1 Tax=Spartinivicinus ruber TaxID=2683272 RepID=UPI0013D55096|nr:hypothetical protein [Spartinivicinus ruber]